MKQKKRKRKFAFLFRFFLKIMVIAAIIYVVLTYVMTFHRMAGNNMFPSVKDGDLCIFYKLDDCHLSDVVLYTDEHGKQHMGRVVAVGGQEVDFPEQGGYFVNEYQPTEEITYQTFREENSDVKYPLTVEDQCFFVMNDFRTDTEDSRVYGTIHSDQIDGKLIFVLRRRGF